MKIISSLLMLTLLYSCATTQKDIGHELKNAPAVRSRDEMINSMRKIFANSKNLTSKQKEEFFELHATVIDEVSDLNNLIRKQKIMLIKEISSTKYSVRRINALKDMLRSSYNAKLSIMFAALSQSREILGVKLKGYMNDHEMIIEHASF